MEYIPGITQLDRDMPFKQNDGGSSPSTWTLQSLKAFRELVSLAMDRYILSYTVGKFALEDIDYAMAQLPEPHTWQQD